MVPAPRASSCSGVRSSALSPRGPGPSAVPGEWGGCMTCMGGRFLALGSCEVSGHRVCRIWAPKLWSPVPRVESWYRCFHVLVCHPRGCLPAFQGRLGLLQFLSPSSGCSLQKSRELYNFRSFLAPCKLSKTWLFLLKGYSKSRFILKMLLGSPGHLRKT